MALVAAAGDTEALGSVLALAEAAGYPQAELEVAKAELKALRRRDCLAVVLRGATGIYASDINGTYMPTNHKTNGWPVFVKAEDGYKCLYRAMNGKWFAGCMAEKDEKSCGGWAYTEIGLAHPTLATEWMVICEHDEWKRQPVGSSLTVSSCDYRYYSSLCHSTLFAIFE